MNLQNTVKTSFGLARATRRSLSTSLKFLRPRWKNAPKTVISTEPDVAQRAPSSTDQSFSSPQTKKTRNVRKLASLKRVGLFGDDTQGAIITRACSLDDLRQAYRLVHEVYVGTGYIAPEPSAMRLRMFETRPDTATFIAKVGDRIVGVLSLVPDSVELGLPSDMAFKVELDAMRKSGLRLCEATNQVVAEEYRKSAIPTELMRCAGAHVTKFGYDEMVATVSPSHNGFYDMLRFREIGSVRSYSDEIEDPVVAMSMNTQQYFCDANDADEAWQFVRHFMTDQNHFLPHINPWAEVSKQLFLSSDLLRWLFVTETGFIDRCTSSEQRILKRLWGYWLFSTVTGRTISAAFQEAMTTGLCWIDAIFLHWSPRPAGLYVRANRGLAS